MQKVNQQQIADRILPFLKAKYGEKVLTQARRYFLSNGTNGKVEVDFTVNGRPKSDSITVKELLTFDPKAAAKAEAKRLAEAEAAEKAKVAVVSETREIRTGEADHAATEAAAAEPEATQPAVETKGRRR